MWLPLLVAAYATPSANLAYTPPAQVHLGVQAGVLDAKAAESGDACDEAAAAALESLWSKAGKADLNTLVSVSMSSEDGEVCKQRRTGDTVLQSVVQLEAMAIQQDPSLPEVAGERAITVMATLGAMSGGLDQARLEAIDETAWWERPHQPLDPDGEASPQDRAATVLVEQVFPALAEHASMMATMPELSGWLYTFEDGKKKSYRGLRVRVPTERGGSYVRGKITEEGLLAELQIDTRSGTGPWTPLDPGSLALGEAGAVRLELRDLDVEDADMVGLEDEEEEE